MNHNLFFTGPPGCGKSTLIEKIIKRIRGPCTGFFTREIKEKGKRSKKERGCPACPDH